MYVVGTHHHKRSFNCFECAERYYKDLDKKFYKLKYLAEANFRGAAFKMLRNTYGWVNR